MKMIIQLQIKGKFLKNKSHLQKKKKRIGRAGGCTVWIERLRKDYIFIYHLVLIFQKISTNFKLWKIINISSTTDKKI